MSESHDATTFVAPALEELASLFPGYDFQGLIACGGMGAVYAAIQRSLDREVAIKVLPRELGDDPSFRAGFETEAKAMARLNHPNLIGVYDFGDVNGMLFIVMEYVPGESLFHAAHGTAIDAGETVRLITGICNGLAHAHHHGIIHRDIKPANILLDLQAEPKIGDFGLARPVENRVVEGEEIFGTPHYTAPEVVHNPHQVDHRADLFSVGVMLHELLTGRLPADDPRPASAIMQCDPRFDAVVRKATDPNPANRYANATDITADLLKISTTPGPRILQTSVRPARKAARRSLPNPKAFHPRPFVVTKKSSPLPTIFLVILLLGALGFGLMHMSRPAGPPTTPPPEDVTALPSTIPEIGSGDLGVVPQATPPRTPKPVSRPPEDDDTGPRPVPIEEPTEETEEPSEPDETPVPTTAATPAFDVEGFLLKAQRVMANSIPPLVAKRDQAILTNINALGVALEQGIRNMPVNGRARASTAAAKTLESWRALGKPIPRKAPASLSIIRDVNAIIGIYVRKQEIIEEGFAAEIAAIGRKYEQGIRLQIDRMDAVADRAAIKKLEEEIKNVREDPGYFRSLMLPNEKDPDDQTGDDDPESDDEDD